MRCPACNTINRDDRERCYHCDKDLSLLRLIVNQAKSHYNQAAEHVEKAEYPEAMAELNSALQLDRTLAEARVLRGVVFLRMNRHEDARREWEMALGLNPMAARATRYLNELGQLPATLDMARRARRLSAVGLGAVILGGALTLWAFVPNWEDRQVSRAWGYFGRTDLASAVAELDRLPNPLSDRSLEPRVLALRNAVGALESRALAEATESIAQGRLEEARGKLTRARGLRPTERTLEEIERLERQVVQAAVLRVTAAAASARTAADFAQTRTEIDRARALGLGEAEAARLTQDVDKRANLAFTLAFDTAERDLANDDNPAATVRLAIERAAATAGTPAQRDRVGDLNTRLAEREWARMTSAASRALDANDTAVFEATLRELEGVEVLPPEVSARIEALRAAFAERRRTEAMNALEQAIASGDNARALALAESLAEQAGLDDSLRARIEPIRERAAVDAYYRLMRAADRIESGALDRDEAETVRREVELARAALPERLAAQAADELEFFGAAAAWALGETDVARSAMEALRERIPTSPYHALWSRLESRAGS